MLYHETNQERIVTMGEVLHQGKWLSEEDLEKVRSEVDSYPWWKVAAVLEAFQAKIDEERPWKMRKAVSRYTIREAIDLETDDINAPF